MPCLNPIQGFFDYSKGSFFPCSVAQRVFEEPSSSLWSIFPEETFRESMTVPCGRCQFCRLERSRQVAVRALHESNLYENNCFVTLTFSDDMIGKMCPLVNGRYSLVRKHTQDFMKRLREKFTRGVECYGGKLYRSDKIRVLGCGEYGDNTVRPHYHLCLFNVDFPDRRFYKMTNGFKYYNSDILDSLWSYDGVNIGHAVVGDFSFETAAYVARYCTKKVIGDKAKEHYRGLLPEFGIYSNKPGLGADWFEKHKSDFMNSDSVVVRGVESSLPRYYNKLWERFDSSSYAFARSSRLKKASQKLDDNTYERLRAKEQCMDARMKLLVRSLEKHGVD